MALTYSIIGGPDADKFNIDPMSGDLSFKVAPDFENPGSAAGTNEYRVTVGATDPAAAVATQDRVITVTDVNEAPPNQPPEFTSPANVSVPENQTAVDTVQAFDPDEGPVDPPPVTGWPDASNTGVRPGVTLTNAGTITTTQAGQVIAGVSADRIDVRHQNVQIRDCNVADIMAWDGDATGLLIEYVECRGGGNNSGFSLGNAHNGIIRNCNIHGCENSMWLEGNGMQILNNWMHGASAPGNPDPHYDGLQLGGPSNMLIRGNNFDFGAGQSSSITMSNANNIDIDGNRIRGGTYTIYIQSSPGCSVTNNHFIEKWEDGGWVFDDSNATYSGNVDANGNPLSF